MVKITTAANVIEILKIIKFSTILVRKTIVRQLGIGLVIQIIFQISKKKIYNGQPFIILNFDFNQCFKLAIPGINSQK